MIALLFAMAMPSAIPEKAFAAPHAVTLDGPAAGASPLAAVADFAPASPADAPRTPGEIVVSAPPRPTAADPLEHINIATYQAMQSVDRGIVAPVAFGYQRTVPAPVRDGIHNLLSNLDEPVVFLNFLAQHKLGKATETVGRFAVNSTLGLAGLFDVAKRKRFRLPHRPNGFADTLGFYGIRPGPFFFLPLVGPTTLRDMAGGLVDRLVLPLGVGVPFNQLGYTLPTGVLKGLDRRLRKDDELREQRDAARPYVSAREFYLARRQSEIDHLRGRAPVSLSPSDAHP